MRADERTRTADLLITSDNNSLQGFAQDCKSRIDKRFLLLRLTARCTLLRSRWCHSSVNWCRSSGLCTGAADTSARMHGWSTRHWFLLGGGGQYRRSLLSSPARKYSWWLEACAFERPES